MTPTHPVRVLSVGILYYVGKGVFNMSGIGSARHNYRLFVAFRHLVIYFAHKPDGGVVLRVEIKRFAVCHIFHPKAVTLSRAFYLLLKLSAEIALDSGS